ncbi:hypothetical protein M569_07096 [Genlisea aurea]|uniref:Reverse transcriptase Ty1/copia-type domain-containing protein n=1 Tax=Genlisea aurea TaxID=192259 RepID=S8DWS2_9LAMI|nr:hypothetical protein M569_07096 [Genlisea aurea]
MAFGLAESQGLSGHLTGEIKAPQQYEDLPADAPIPAARALTAAYIRWRTADRLLRSWLLSTVSDETWPLIVGCDTVESIWTALQDAFALQSDERRYSLRLQLAQMRKKSDQSLDDYLMKFKTVIDNLGAIGDHVPDGERVYCLLTSLGSAYDVFSTSMLKEPRPSYRDLIPQLQSFERQKGNQSRFSSERRGFQAQTGQRGNQQRNAYSTQGKVFPPPPGKRRMTPREREMYQNEEIDESNPALSSQTSSPVSVVTHPVPDSPFIASSDTIPAVNIINGVSHQGPVTQAADAVEIPAQSETATLLTSEPAETTIPSPNLESGTFENLDLNDFVVDLAGVSAETSCDLNKEIEEGNVNEVPTGPMSLERVFVSDEPVMESPKSYPTSIENAVVAEEETGAQLPESVVSDEPMLESPESDPALIENVVVAEEETGDQRPESVSNLNLITNEVAAAGRVVTGRVHPMVTRSQVGIRKPNPKYALSVVSNIPVEPRTVREALTHVGWKKAMDEELEALHKNDTWDLVPKDGIRHVIGCKWVYKAKLNPDGTLNRLKARLVAKGYNQVDGIDYTETFSPVIRPGLIEQLSSEFAMKDLGILHHFLGVQLKYTEDGVLLTQAHYALSVLDRFGYKECKPAETPLVSKVNLQLPSKLLSDPTPFRALVGALQYLTFTRPDIAYSVNFVAQFMQSPSEYHHLLATRILKYVKHTIHLGLYYERNSPLQLNAYSDADWAACPLTRRSVTGYCVLLGQNPISWSSKKQHTVSRSSTEAEYRAMAHTAAEVTWIQFLLRDIKVELIKTPVLHCDNLSALHLTVNPVFHARSKHVEIDYHFVRERVALGYLTTRHIPTRHQLADLFTKRMTCERLTFLKSKLCLKPLLNERRSIEKDETSHQQT